MKWLHWSVFILGVWILISPWILGYWRITPALWNQVVAGVLVILLSLWGVVGVDEENNNNNNQP